MLPIFFPFLSGGVEQRASYLLESSVDSKNVGTTKALLPEDTVTESPPRMKIISRFREEFTKKVGTFLKGGGNKELSSSFSTSPSAWYLEEQEAYEQKRRKWLVFELKLRLIPLFFPLLSGGVEQRVSYLLESSVDSKKVEEVIYTLVS